MSPARRWKVLEESLWVFRIAFEADIREYVPDAPTFCGVIGRGLIDHLVDTHNKQLLMCGQIAKPSGDKSNFL
jgi:hypothetical protein